MPDASKSERLNLSLSGPMLTAIDEWRRIQPDIPNRTEATRRLIEAGLAATTPKAKR